MSTTDLPGSSLLANRYRLVERLGAGGMSVVWRGFDEVLGRQVAVKVLPPSTSADPSFRRRLRAEAQAAARLSHPHITNVYDYGEATTVDGEPVPYVVMELVDGESLAAVLARSRRLPWPAAVRISAEVAAALAAAHARGIVHRDVTPANVMLTPTGAKVVDFGISALIGENDIDPDGSLLGTPAYLAPERLEGGQVSPATDVYAVGLLIYRTLIGQLPWDVGTTTALLRAHQYTEPEPLPPVEGLPNAVSTLIASCLQKRPSHRPSSAELAHVLGTVSAGVPAARAFVPDWADSGEDTTILPSSQQYTGAFGGVRPGQARVAESAPGRGVAAVPAQAAPVSPAPGAAVPPVSIAEVEAAVQASAAAAALPSAPPGSPVAPPRAARNSRFGPVPPTTAAASGGPSYGKGGPPYGPGFPAPTSRPFDAEDDSHARGDFADGDRREGDRRDGDRRGADRPDAGSSGGSPADASAQGGRSAAAAAPSAPDGRNPALRPAYGAGPSSRPDAVAAAGAPPINRPGTTAPAQAPRPGRLTNTQRRRIFLAAGAAAGIGVLGWAFAALASDPPKDAVTNVVAPQPAQSTKCVVSYAVWSDDGDRFKAAVTVANRDTKAVDNWKLWFLMPGDQVVSGNGKVKLDQQQQQVTVSGSAALSPQATTTMQFTGRYAASNAAPMVFQLDGETCDTYVSPKPGDPSRPVEHLSNGQVRLGPVPTQNNPIPGISIAPNGVAVPVPVDPANPVPSDGGNPGANPSTTTTAPGGNPGPGTGGDGDGSGDGEEKPSTGPTGGDGEVVPGPPPSSGTTDTDTNIDEDGDTTADPPPTVQQDPPDASDQDDTDTSDTSGSGS